jgi:phage anti-repressor protein
MDDFIKQHTTLPEKFIDDFYFITNKSHHDTDIVIEFNLVHKWLSTNKNDLKRVLIKNFDENYDYIETKLTKKDGAKSNNYTQIKISSACFKELCMISQTAKAKEVRKYFLEMEKIVKKYYELIREKLYEKIGLLKNNQKPKTKKAKGGVIYIIEAMNSDDTLYKLGKSKDLDKRIQNYNTGNANDIIPLFELYVKDIDSVETCVKNACKKYQYRKYKEVYEIDINMLKEIMVSCDEFSESLKTIYEKYEKLTTKNIQRIKKSKHNLFIVMKSIDNINMSNKKSKSKIPTNI